MTKIGSIGARLDLAVRAGDTLGPFTATLVNSISGTPVNVTGFQWDAAVSELDTEDGLVPLTVTVLDGPAGKIEFKLADSTALETTDSTFFKDGLAYSWFLKGTDLLGTKQTYLYGYVSVAAKEPT